MSEQQNIEHFYQLLDETSSYLAQAYHKPYLEAVIDAAEQFFQGDLVLEATDEQRARMEAFIHRFEQLQLSNEELRRGLQLVILNGMKADHIPGTGITPDAVAMFMGFLANKFSRQPSTVLDPAVGIGNLLSCVLNQYSHEIKAFGIEVDPTLVRLAYVNTNLQKHQVELYHQDALKPVYINPADLIVCDLPIGIYPNTQAATGYQLYAEGEVLYTHHLLIEQALRLTAEGGYLLLLIPNHLFVEDGAMRLRQLITEQAFVQALLQLPSNLFVEGSILKSIFILQKKGNKVLKPKQTLIASLPSFSNPASFSKVLAQINQWLVMEKGEHML